MTVSRAPIKVGPYHLEATDDGTLVLSLNPSITPPPLWSEVEEDVQRNAVDDELDELRRYRAWSQKPRSRPFEFLSPFARQIMDPDGEVLRYSPDQPRDDHGRFGEGSGDSGKTENKFAEGVRAAVENLRTEGRTEKNVTRIGGMVRDEIDRRMAPYDPKAGLEAHNEAMKAFISRVVDAESRVSSRELEHFLQPTAETGKALEEAKAEHARINAEGDTLREARQAFNTKEALFEGRYGMITRQVLEEIRPFGPSETSAHHLFGFDEGVAAVEQAMKGFPTAWLENSAAAGKFDKGWISIEAGTRGAYSHGENASLRLPVGESASTLRMVATHEMGHRFEDVVPRAKALERAFYERRVGKDAMAKPPSPIPGYAESEKARPDHFISPYMGKDYGGKNYELLSMGVENVLGGGRFQSEVRGDRDYHHFILGMLAAL